MPLKIFTQHSKQRLLGSYATESELEFNLRTGGLDPNHLKACGKVDLANELI